MKSFKSMLLGCATGAAVLAGASAALAEAAPAGPATQVETLVVTAQKREQSVQDVPLSVTAYGSEQIRALGLQSGADVANAVSGVQVYNFRGGAPTFVVRGIGTQDFEPNTAPAAATYVDEVYLGSNILTGLAVFDTERVEVLKGPQGTLFGRNTTAGAISYTSKRPTSNWQGYAQAGYGDYDTFHFDGAVSGPISDKLTFRLAGQADRQGEGWFRNIWTPASTTLPLSNGVYSTGPYQRHKSTIGDGSDYALRVMLDYKASDDFDVLLKLHGGELHGDTQPVEPYGFTSIPGATAPCNALVTGVSDPAVCGDALGKIYRNSNPYIVNQDYVGTNVEKNAGATLRMQWSAPTFDAISISSWEYGTKVDHDDNDGSPNFQLNQVRDVDLDAYSQEVRLASSGRKDLTWIAGTYASYEVVHELFCGALSPALGFTNFPDPAFAHRVASECRQNMRDATTTGAAYANAEWAFAPGFSLIVGGRYTYEHSHFNSVSRWIYNDGFSPTSVVANFGATPADAAAGDETKDDRNLSGKIGLNYHAMEGLLLYASASRGFKSGGFDADFSESRSQLNPYQAEIMVALEAGFKATLDDGKLLLDGAIYHYDYSNPQVRVQAFDANTGLPLNRLVNLDNSKVLGGELSAVWKPVQGLLIQAGANLMNTKLYDPKAAYDGNQLPLAAKDSETLLARYSWPVAESWDAALQVDLKHSGSYYLNPENTPFLHQSGFTIVNGRVSLMHDGDWELDAWGKNLTNKAYMVSSYALFGSYPVSFSPPRTYGVTLRRVW